MERTRASTRRDGVAEEVEVKRTSSDFSLIPVFLLVTARQKSFVHRRIGGWYWTRPVANLIRPGYSEVYDVTRIPRLREHCMREARQRADRTRMRMETDVSVGENTVRTFHDDDAISLENAPPHVVTVDNPHSSSNFAKPLDRIVEESGIFKKRDFLADRGAVNREKLSPENSCQTFAKSVANYHQTIAAIGCRKVARTNRELRIALSETKGFADAGSNCTARVAPARQFLDP